jgi:hypothetical protein
MNDIPAPYETLGLVDQIVWNPKKEELSDYQRFSITMIAAAIEYMRDTNMYINPQTVTADELIEYAKAI